MKPTKHASVLNRMARKGVSAGGAKILKVLLVDDMRTMRTHARAMLADRDYLIMEAPNGEEALELVESCKPHLILMDIVMPKMDGVTCCRRIKSNSRLRDIKIIMVTGKGEYSQIAEAFRAGCDDYITKPIDREELLKKVDELSKYVLCRRRLNTLLNDDTAPERLPTRRKP